MYGKNGEEHMFKEIQQEKIVNFGITNNDHYVVENIENGTFIIDNVPITIKGFSNKSVDYRIIYFRRIQQALGGNSDVSPVAHMGLQYTEDNTNHKVIISIADAGILNYNIEIK